MTLGESKRSKTFAAKPEKPRNCTMSRDKSGFSPNDDGTKFVPVPYSRPKNTATSRLQEAKKDDKSSAIPYKIIGMLSRDRGARETQSEPRGPERNTGSAQDDSIQLTKSSELSTDSNANIKLRESFDEIGREQIRTKDDLSQTPRPSRDTRFSRPSHPDLTRPPTALHSKGTKLACPYLKFNPAVYGETLSCTRYFPSTHRLKEHLYRHHEQKPNCLRCGRVFENQADSAEHAQLEEPCNLIKNVSIEGFDKDQLKKLKSRKRARGDRSEEENWRNIYRILFPDCNVIPDPFYRIQYDDSIVEHSDLQELFTQDNDSGIDEQFFSKLEEIAEVSLDSAKRRAMLGLFKTFARKKIAETNKGHGPQHPGDACIASTKAISSSTMKNPSDARCGEDLTSSIPQDASVASLAIEAGTDGIDDTAGIASYFTTFDSIDEYDFTRALLDDQIPSSTPWQEANSNYIEGGLNQSCSYPFNEYLNMAAIFPDNTTNEGISVYNGVGKHMASNSLILASAEAAAADEKREEAVNINNNDTEADTYRMINARE
ncbi:uncharacterized protein BDZ83DRAFT_790118 [Colletotrichum acutatum]|uniref:C2H2-type domain-containing protein n=1 Tax=Glomerella acutata TaxID=27357 RepID=A0AAD8UV32_GLOAC|nr:uncharacterized protein BDZ83DRAFT_790118 [Colletotrichum acutatum]KAK1727826.1 hypothetical protein BDZ83DRAFT_790118 [Colletotrichum acutatum]